MKNVSIYGAFTVLNTYTINDIIINEGYDEYAEIFYRFSTSVDITSTKLNNIQEFYYNQIPDLLFDIKTTIIELELENNPDSTKIIKDLRKTLSVILIIFKGCY